MNFIFAHLDLGQTLQPLLAEGLLPHRGSLMLDVVFLAMMAVLPIQAFSVFLVKYRKKFALHRNIQVGTAAVLLVAIVAFEIDLRFFTDWRSLAADSRVDQNWIGRLLFIHLVFAIPTPFVWGWTIYAALKNFGWNAQPNEYGVIHKRWGILAVSMMAMTSATGWTFYIAAFVL